MTIGENLAALIEDNDSTMEDLAKVLNCSTKQIQRWKNDKAEMGIYKLREICIYFNVSADYILNLPKGMKRPR